jgi:hypothetical protein
MMKSSSSFLSTMLVLPIHGRGIPGVRYIISNLKGFSRAITQRRTKTNTTELRSI